MSSLSTTFAGLNLRNPIIVSSSTLTGVATQNRAFAEAGAGAIVLKSLFEENIVRESEAMSDCSAHSEAADYMQAYISSNALGEYLKLIKESKSLCGETPIIASINCTSRHKLVDFAKSVEAAGADALEINVMSIESSAVSEDGELERRHIEVAQSVSEAIQIPIIMKLSAQISNHVSLVSRLAACGVKGFVMFNRLYQSDIDIETMTYTRGAVLTTAVDLATPLKYIAVTSAAVPQTTFALSGGVQDGEDIIKAILAGASAVEVCSAFYRVKDSAEWIKAALAKIESWQSEQGFEGVEEFVGRMNGKEDEHRDEIMRAQFLKHFGTYQR